MSDVTVTFESATIEIEQDKYHEFPNFRRVFKVEWREKIDGLSGHCIMTEFTYNDEEIDFYMDLIEVMRCS